MPVRVKLERRGAQASISHSSLVLYKKMTVDIFVCSIFHQPLLYPNRGGDVQMVLHAGWKKAPSTTTIHARSTRLCRAHKEEIGWCSGHFDQVLWSKKRHFFQKLLFLSACLRAAHHGLSITRWPTENLFRLHVACLFLRHFLLSLLLFYVVAAKVQALWQGIGQT